MRLVWVIGIAAVLAFAINVEEWLQLAAWLDYLSAGPPSGEYDLVDTHDDELQAFDEQLERGRYGRTS